MKADKDEQDVDVSIDDTLRSTSPIPDNEEMPVEDTRKEDEQITPRSDGSGKQRLFVRSNSYTLDKPSVALLIAERVSNSCLSQFSS